MSSFVQAPPRLEDPWSGDRTLRAALRSYLGDEMYSIAETSLSDLGAVAVHPRTLELAARAEAEPPTHVPYSTWGERVDEIIVSPAWLELGRIGIQAGVTALPYEDSPYGDKARVVWAAAVNLWGPSSALYSCPVAMTDGAARTLLEHGDLEDLEIVERLTTRDWNRAWTSGQWMTEMAGGSDISGTATVARRAPDGGWRLWGTKWFTSATTSQIALTLARPEGAPDGSHGLSLFRIHRHNPDGTPNSIFVRRLKDKLGTRTLPTAELELQGSVAFPVGDPLDGGGVRRMATMLNITRLHNAVGASGALARGLAWARAYARVRNVMGRPLSERPAHLATLTDLAADYAASLELVLRCAELTGRVEHGTASREDIILLRGLTPVTKLATGRWSIAGVTEAMEAVGGVGYCEDSTIPALVRNTHVIPIWEGTTNVLALDLLRASERSGAFEALVSDARRCLEIVESKGALGDVVAAVRKVLDALTARAAATATDRNAAEAGARGLAMGLASTYACARLCEQASESGDARTAALATRLASRGLVPGPSPDDLVLGMDDPAPATQQI